jgi:outer membrane lipoprotein
MFFRSGKMKSRFLWIFFLSLMLLVSGCAHVISKDLRTKSDLSITLAQVRQNPDAFKGKMVVWGGEIVETVNQQDGTTQIEVYQKPLGWRGEPKNTTYSEGRFLVLADYYLDPYVFRGGRKITVAGEIQGEKIKPLGQMDYRYPLLLSKQIYFWPEYYYRTYPYAYYDPWWWGYPYWGWGFGIYYHYHPRYYHRHR